MKQKLLLKTLLLLCALVAGSSSVWATVPNNPKWIATSLGSISDNATVIIISNSTTATNIALPSTTTTSNPEKKACTVSTTEGLTTITPPAGTTLQNLAWTLKKVKVKINNVDTDAYQFYQEGSNSVRLYLTGTSSNTALRVGNASSDNDNFVLGSSSKLLKVTTAERYVGPYDNNGTDWRTYNSETATNYKGATLTFYVLQTYTITAQSNNVDYGTVSLTDNVITGSPKSGYRYATPAYTVSSGTATVSQNGNAFTVSPSSDCTITINFEAIPSHTLSTAVSPASAGSVELGATSIKEGATTTATATAAAGYKFTSWSISGTGASLSSTTTNPTTVTMGTADATVTANFEAVTTHAISYSVNGNVVKTVNVEEDAAVDLSAPASGIPAGYVFKGWVVEANKIDTPTDTDPQANYVTSATSTVDITYYAVMAVRTSSSPDTYQKLANNSFDTNATYVIGGVQGGSGGDGTTMMYLNAYSAVDEDIAWGTCTSTPSTVTPVTFRLSGTAAALVAKDNSGNYLAKSNDEKKFAMSSTSKTVYLDEDGSIKSASDGWLMRYNHNNGNGGLRWYNSTTGQQAYFYKVIDNCTYANYCTSLPSSIIIDPHATYMTLTSKYPLDFTNVNNLTAYIVTDDNASDGYVTLTQVNKVPANTGLVLKASSTVYPISVDVLAGAADDVTGNKMAGSAFSTTAIAANGGYILKNGAFHPASAGNLPEGKAYLNIEVPAGAPVLNLNFGGTTGINAVNGSEFKVNGEYYNLAGQRVAQPTKGLYIVNGKKVIIK